MIVRMAVEIDEQPKKNPLHGVVNITDDATTKVPTIIITPTLGKRKFDQVDSINGQQ